MIRAILIILIVSVPLFFIYQETGYFYGIYGEAKEALAQGLIAVLLCVWLLKKKFTFRKDALTIPIVVFFSLMCLSVLWAYNPYESLKFIKRWASHILLYFILINNVGTKEVARLMKLMILTAVVVSAYGIAQYCGWDYRSRIITCSSTMGNPSFVGAFLAGIIPLGMALTMRVRNLFSKMFYFLLSLGMFVALVVANSRAAWVGLAGGVVVMFMFSSKKKVFLRYLALALIVGSIAISFSSFPVKERLASTFDLSYHTNHQRIEIWKGTLRMIRERPFGVGIGNFNLFYPLYQTREFLDRHGYAHFIRQAHNVFLELAADIGVLGLMAFLWIFFVLIRKFRSKDVLSLGLLGGISAFLITAMFSYNLQNESSVLYLWLSMGLYIKSLECDL